MKQFIWKWMAGGALLLFVVLVAAHLVIASLDHLTFPKRDGLYAVFLNNGQVYFGSITKEDHERLVLEHIYYVQLKNASSSASGDVSLLKLGNEFHGPEDMMEINRAQILFLEKLKADGKVAKAIQSSQP